MQGQKKIKLSPGDSEVGDNARLPTVLSHSAQLRRQNSQLYAPFPLYPQGNALVLI